MQCTADIALYFTMLYIILCVICFPLHFDLLHRVFILIACHFFFFSPFQVSYFDFGNTAIVPAKDIRKLIAPFLILKPQAVEVFLANIELAPDVMNDENSQREAT